MKKKLLAALLTLSFTTALFGCGKSEAPAEAAGGTVYKVGIVQYVDDASLNQIEASIEEQLTKRGEELGVTFNFKDYTYNGQADASTLNQIASGLLADNVDLIIPIATPTAMIMQAATEDTSIPIVFSAVSDPVTAGLVDSLEAPGSHITGTSDAFNTNTLLDLMFLADPELQSLGLLYNKSEDSSTAAIAAAKAYCENKGITYVEKTGTNNDEISLAADALVAAKVDAVFTPTDNTVMTAELAIFEKFIEAGIPHYTGADSFALNGAFCGFGVNYVDLGKATADMAVDILINGADPATTPVQMMSNGIATINTETAEALGLDYSQFDTLCDKVNEITTAQSFE